MFTFIGKICESITNFIAQFFVLVIIVLAVVLLFLATYRKNHNPYIDHTKDQIERQIDNERESQLNEALKSLHETHWAK